MTAIKIISYLFKVYYWVFTINVKDSKDLVKWHIKSDVNGKIMPHLTLFFDYIAISLNILFLRCTYSNWYVLFFSLAFPMNLMTENKTFTVQHKKVH